MAEVIENWTDAEAFALSLDETEASTSYGQPAVKVATNGRAFINLGNEPGTSFVLQLDRDTIEMLIATDPETYWQSKHYQGYAAVLVRFGSPDPERVRAQIAKARDQAAAKPKVRR